LKSKGYNYPEDDRRKNAPKRKTFLAHRIERPQASPRVRETLG